MTDLRNAQDFLQTHQDHDPAETEQRLKSLLNAWVEDPHVDHSSWSEAAEALGHLSLALREAHLAVRFQPDHPIALMRLGQLLLERGQGLRARVHLEAALALAPDNAQIQTLLAELPDLDLESQTSDSEGFNPKPSSRTTENTMVPHEASAIRFLQTFGGREDIHARQWAQRDGRSGYSPVQQALTPRLIQGHLIGNDTLGVYCLRVDGTVNFIALDLDITKATLEEALVNRPKAEAVKRDLQSTTEMLYQSLQDLGLDGLIENSGYKGRHLWILLAQPLPADVAYVLGTLIYRQVQSRIPAGLHLEVFPKQGNLDTKKAMGNLIKLPLGVHRKSNRRSHFMTVQGERISAWDRYLAEFPRMQPEQIYLAIESLKRQDLPELRLLPEDASRPLKPLPAPSLVQRVWTAADFETEPEIALLLQRCPVLNYLKEQAEQSRQLSNHEQLVLIHTLGQLKTGTMAVNYLFSRCANIAPERYLKSTLQGSPTSCAKIRSRIPHVTSKVKCNCRFENAPDHYPTPELHLRMSDPPAAPVKAPESLEQQARRYAALERRIDELGAEHVALGKNLSEAILQLEGACLELPEGRYRVVQNEELASLIWEAKDVT